MGVGEWFSDFCSKLRMSDSVVLNVRTRYQRITKRINIEYWDSSSEIAHSIYVGSYGRGTAIYTSDIDMIVELPWSVKTRMDSHFGNKQSDLLTEVKNKLLNEYASSKVSSDGQVVVIDFSDGIRFEVVPAFKNSDGSYCYPDTNNGGSWKSMDPKREMDSFNVRNNEHNKTMKKVCRMIRAWNTECNVTLPGDLIDAMVYDFYFSNGYVDKAPYTYFDWISRDFYKYINDNAILKTWFSPGTYRSIVPKYRYDLQSKAKSAYDRSLKAIEYEKDNPNSAKAEWRKIYGSRFPQ